MGKSTEALHVNAKEFDAFCRENDALSDMQEAGVYDGITYKPAIEWDGPYGKHWVSFETEEAMYARLDRYDREIAKWVVEYRSRGGISEMEADLMAIAKKRAEAKRKVAHEKKVARSLGGQHPVLAQLLAAARG